LDELRQLIVQMISTEGLTSSEELKSPLKGVHWRDIYQRHKHRTRVVVTPDTRPSAPLSLEPVWPDWRLNRFLIARRNNVKKAARMFVDYLEWYQNFGVEDLMNQPNCPFGELMGTFFPERIHGTDKDGNPLILGYAGGISLETYKELNLPIEIVYIIQTYQNEYIEAACAYASAKCGKRLTGVSLVQDLEGLSLAHRTGINWFSNIFFLNNNFYPESAAQMVVINAPGVFSLFWSVIKGMLDERTASKTHIFSRNPKAVFDLVGVENAPAEMGGGCKRCNGQCLPQVKVEDRAKKQEALSKRFAALEESGTLEKAHLPARKVVTHTVQLSRSSSVGADQVENAELWWSIQTNNQLDFSVTFKPSGSKDANSYTVVNVTRHQKGTHRGSHHFSLLTDADGGEVSLVFDNKMSTFTAKDITFKAGVVRSTTTI